MDWKRLSRLEKAEAVSEYLVNHTKSEAEQYFNISRCYLNELMRALKISQDENIGSYDGHWEQLCRAEKAKAVLEYLINHTWAEAAQYFNVSERTIADLSKYAKGDPNLDSTTIEDVAVSEYPVIDPLKDEASLYNCLKQLKSNINKMEERKRKLELEISLLEKDMHRKSESVTATNYLRKILSPIEKKEDEIIAMLNRTSFDGVQRIEIRRWISLLTRLQSYLEESLTIIQAQGDYIDIGIQ